MDDNELVVCFAASIAATFLWGRWFRRAASVFAPRCPTGLRLLLIAVPPALLASLAWMLHAYAPADVKNDPGYLTLFCAVGAVTLYAGCALASVLGMNPISDGIERVNSGVVAAVVGLWFGVTALNVGSNIGAGATITTTLFPLAIACGEIGLFAIAVAWCSGFTEAVARDQSLAAGFRFAGFVFSASLPLARAASGDWVSYSATMRDLMMAAPALACLLVAATILERVWPSSASRSALAVFFRGIIPSLSSVGLTWYAMGRLGTQ